MNPDKIMRVLHLLKIFGHPYYQFFDDINSYEIRCKEQDERGHQLLFGVDDSEEEMEENNTLNEGIPGENTNESDEESDTEDTKKDPIKKF